MKHPSHLGPIILVVDTRPDDYVSFAPWAKKNGIEFRFVSSGQAALRAATEMKPALWMINVKLPEMTGFDLLEMVRDKMGSACAVLVADHYLPQDEMRSAEVGAMLYVCKPLESSWLESLDQGVKPGSLFSGKASANKDAPHRQRVLSRQKTPRGTT